MLTIPTSDFHGCLSDALPFISPNKDDLERRCIELRWDGELFHASAHSGIHLGISSWSPDDKPDTDVQDELEVALGSDDAPWSCVLTLDDAKHLLATAKPVKGLEYVPLFVDWDGQFLTVTRAKQARLPGLKLSYDGQEHAFPDLRDIVVRAASNLEDVKEISFNATYLAAFGTVRQRGGHLKLTFGGPDGPTIGEIGERFVGVIQPVRPAKDES